MAEARSRDDWLRLADLQALIANCHRDRRNAAARSPRPISTPTTNRNPRRKLRGKEMVQALVGTFVD